MVDPQGAGTATRDHEASVTRARRGGRRRLVAVCAALLAGAAALAGAARLPWFTAGVDAVGRGTVAVTATGADLVPGLSGVALLAVAAVAAAVAVAGVARRILGGLVAVAGGWAAVAATSLLSVPPTAADLAALPGAPAGGTPVPGPAAAHAGPVVAALGATLLVAAGVALVLGERRLPRFGSRYARRPDRATTPVADPDRAAWDALDAGIDPTVDDAADRHADPGARQAADQATSTDRVGPTTAPPSGLSSMSETSGLPERRGGPPG